MFVMLKGRINEIQLMAKGRKRYDANLKVLLKEGTTHLLKKCDIDSLEK